MPDERVVGVYLRSCNAGLLALHGREIHSKTTTVFRYHSCGNSVACAAKLISQVKIKWQKVSIQVLVFVTQSKTFFTQSKTFFKTFVSVHYYLMQHFFLNVCFSTLFKSKTFWIGHIFIIIIIYILFISVLQDIFTNYCHMLF